MHLRLCEAQLCAHSPVAHRSCCAEIVATVSANCVKTAAINASSSEDFPSDITSAAAVMDATSVLEQDKVLAPFYSSYEMAIEPVHAMRVFPSALIFAYIKKQPGNAFKLLRVSHIYQKFSSGKICNPLDSCVGA